MQEGDLLPIKAAGAPLNTQDETEGMLLGHTELQATCRRCKTCSLLSQVVEGEALAWTYKRDVLGVNWPIRPDVTSLICYACYVREVFQWARDFE
jgi:hypothetical protein